VPLLPTQNTTSTQSTATSSPRQWVSATSDGDVPRKPNTVRRHPSAAKGICRYVSRSDAAGSGPRSGGTSAPHPKQRNTAPTVLIIASGALTAAVARMEPSNTTTDDVESVGPRNITRATCRARGVSRRSSKAALTPTRAVVIRAIRATIMSNCWSDVTCTIPSCKSGSSRPPPLGTRAATTTKGPLIGSPS